MSIARFAGLALGAAACLLGAAPSGTAQAQTTDEPQALQPLTITTGGTSGLYYSYARTLARLMPRTEEVRVLPSDGSIHNLQRLLGYETQVENEDGSTQEVYFQLAMVQADVLDQLRKRAENNPILKQVVDNIKIVLPLYNEEIHAYTLADYELKGLQDILDHNGQINAGTTNSGTFMTVNSLLQHMGAESRISGLDTTPLKEGLSDLIFGNFDVAFAVAGAGYDFGLNVPPGSA